MALDAYISNPVGWAQLMLQGGPRRILTIALVYAGILVAANVLIYRAVSENVPLDNFADGSLAVTIFIQAGLFVLAGCGAIKKAILRDFTSDMITSHRNSAMTGQVAVLGYLTGATLGVLSLSAVNLLAMIPLSTLAGHGPFAPMLLFVVFGCLTLFLWTMAVLAGLSSRGTFSFVGVVIVLGFLANAQIFMMVHPGLSLVMSYAPLRSLVNAGAVGGMDLSVLVSMLSQIMLSLVFFMAAARKFQRDDVPAFTPLLAFILLALVTLISTIGLRFYRSPGLAAIAGGVGEGTQLVATLASLALVAMLPVAVAARRAAMWCRRRLVDAHYAEPAPRPWYEAPLAATLLVFFILLIICGLIFIEVNPERPLRQALTAAVLPFLFALASMSGLLRALYERLPKVGAMGAIALALFWAGPVLGDLAVEALTNRHHTMPRSWLFGASPVGTWLIAFSGVRCPMWPGLAAQGLVACAMLLLPLAARASRASNRAAPLDHTPPRAA